MKNYCYYWEKKLIIGGRNNEKCRYRQIGWNNHNYITNEYKIINFSRVLGTKDHATYYKVKDAKWQLL